MNTENRKLQGFRLHSGIYFVGDESFSVHLIIRLYESMNGTRSAKLKTAFATCKVYECNMLETPLKEPAVENNEVSMEFRPFEIKTLRLKK